MLEIVRVVAAHPESHSVDVVLVRTGARVAGVQVLASMAGAGHGVSGLAVPAEQGSADQFSAPIDPERVIYGVVAMLGMPVLVGFLHPQVGQMAFPDANRFVWRHPSDFYATVNDGGDVELSHPSGTYLRIGTNADHEDLTGRDADKRWAIQRNTGASPTVRIAVASGGAASHTTLTIAPGGNVTVECDGNLSISAGGTAAISAAGKLTLHSDAAIEATAPRIDLN